MAKFDFEVAVAFATQTAEGTYNATLDGITTSLSHTQGLLLGDPEAGVYESGLTLTLGRKRKDKAFLGSSRSRPLSDFLAAEVPTFTFAVPFVGNRADASDPPVDADATPLVGIDALLEGVGLVGAAWGGGVGWEYAFGSPYPISALVYYSGNRLELLDCRCAHSIVFPYAGIPILTATIEVGSIKDHSVAALPTTLTWGEQATVSAPTCVSLANQWQDTRGFGTGTLAITPEITDVGDVNAATGIVKEETDREVIFTGDLFADSTVDKGYEYSQLIETTQGNLDELSFLVGSAMTANNPAEAVAISIPDPELTEASPIALGSKAGHDVNLIGRGTGSGDNELYIRFR